MDHLEFFRYHNRLIEFTYKGIREKGVVLDVIPYSQKKQETDYAFIPYEHLETWRNASDIQRRQLEKTVDIRDISKVELLRLPA